MMNSMGKNTTKISFKKVFFHSIGGIVRPLYNSGAAFFLTFFSQYIVVLEFDFKTLGIPEKKILVTLKNF